MTSVRRAAAIAAAFLLVLSPVGAARADVQSDVAHDLAVSGVPGAQVTLSAPAGSETELRRANTAAPILRITYTPPDAAVLSGLLPPDPGILPLYNRNTGEELVWELAIVEATKHALARGASLGGVAITTHRSDGSDETLTAALPEGALEVQAPPTLSPDQVRTQVQAALPQWAASATVNVTDDDAGERIVSVDLARPAEAFKALNVPEAAQKLTDQQIELAPIGGNIGRVILRVKDPVAGDPLYVAAGDVLFGYLSQWYSPLVRAWARPVVAVGEDTPGDVTESVPKDPGAVVPPVGGAAP
jgi:hypothetical protein